MIGTLSISMMWSGLLPWPLVTLIFGRDVLLVSGTFYHRLKTKDVDTAFFDTSDSGAFEVKPTMISKVNTALQFALFGFTLTNAAWQVPFDPALQALLYVSSTHCSCCHPPLLTDACVLAARGAIAQWHCGCNNVCVRVRVSLELHQPDRSVPSSSKGQGDSEEVRCQQASSGDKETIAFTHE